MPAKVITIFNQKGGCAKTMTTMQLGGTLGSRGLRVFIIDMDPQNTAALWFHEATEPPFPATVMSMAPLHETFISKIDSIIAKHDVLIVDCPPALDSKVPWASLLMSDFAIIPVVPVMDNIWASKQAEQLVLAAQKENPDLRAAYLVSMLRRGKIYDHCLSTLEGKAQIPFFETRIAVRNAYPECQPFGCVVSAFGDSSATDEMNSLSKEVAAHLGLKLTRTK